jgi:hypothetical protein
VVEEEETAVEGVEEGAPRGEGGRHGTLENPFASAFTSMVSPAHSSSSSSDEPVLPTAPAAVVQTINVQSRGTFAKFGS